MPDLLTEITEIVTGLGMTGVESLTDALAERPVSIGNVTDAHWARLENAYAAGLHRSFFAAAWENGRTFFESSDALRGRVPLSIEWKGSHQAPGFDFVPVDLRIDHVFLVSCKYQSKIVANSSPANLFLRRLADRTTGAETISWYSQVAPDQYQHFYSCVRRFVGQHLLPPRAEELTLVQARRIRLACDKTWPVQLRPLWREFSTEIATASAARWLEDLKTPARQEEMLWRLLRLSSSNYFVLGSSDAGPLRIRIGTPWDWRQAFILQRLDIAATAAGQPRIAWSAQVLDKTSGLERIVRGHVEIRWAHGRFSSVEAKVYLDTPHVDVPGYFPLSSSAT